MNSNKLSGDFLLLLKKAKKTTISPPELRTIFLRRITFVLLKNWEQPNPS